ncbi:hypothetical protein GRI89_12545 [Altererythrobacter salegens]|uniref:PDZ domain-containing protein n=1 Tax=Croceibacterium salegens TaxID=1737568 RepID=A0A6I4SYA3_9SPHN|nr:hypothetical protein [Croceibacterium salegens]MXO60368.1 hypothetical protein [Croceibacterium salegens]
MQNSNALEASSRWHPNAFWLIVAAFTFLVALGTNVLEIRYSYFTQEGAGRWGMTFSQRYGDALVLSVEPGSIADEQGVKPGDILRPLDQMTLRAVPLSGEKIRLTRVSPGPEKSIIIVTTPADQPLMAVPNLTNRVLDDTVRLLLLFGGAFIIWRAWGRRSSFMLGLALMTLSPFPMRWVPLAALEGFVWELSTQILYYFVQLALVLFAMAFLTERGIRVPHWANRLFWLMLVFHVAYFAIDWLVPLGTLPDLLLTLKAPTDPLSALGTWLLTFAVLWFGWRRVDAASHHRTALFLLAIVAMNFGNSLFSIYNLFPYTRSDPAYLTATSTGTRIVGLFLFAYAILRHRVIDTGFAINRTLVYGAVTFTLLVAFGLVEWSVEHLVPEAWHEGGAYISAALAVGLFLAFHRLREWFEHYIERLFFREWQLAEKKLRRFVASAGHFDKSPALCSATVEAVSSYADGVSSALYLRHSDGTYLLEAGQLSGAPECYSGDNPGFALMRAERKPLDLLNAPGALPGELALPMIEHGALAGFVLLEGKADGTHYRPDQVELLDWAVQHIGLDLRALQARQLEAQNRELADRNEWLSEANTLLVKDKERLVALLARAT